MDENDKQQLRDDLEFAIMKVEQLSVLDPRAPPSSKKNPMEIKCLHDIFAVFGYSSKDFIDKHDRCFMFKKLRGELNDLLCEVSKSHPKKYDKAILLRDRLKSIKKEFIETQGKYEKNRQANEQTHFQRGVTLSKKQCDQICETRKKTCEQEIEFKKNDLQKTHLVEKQQLESFLKRLPQPHTKFSTLLLELKNTEKSLAKLRLFEDAKNVYVKADAMEKDERAKWAANFEKFKETKRALLCQKQADELAELDEKLMEKRYILMRSNDRNRTIESQRVKNLHHDMGHAHVMDLHDKKVFSTNATPSTRKHHGATASSFRGQQLLSTVQGKRLEVASLCDLHNQENGFVPHGSVIYTD